MKETNLLNCPFCGGEAKICDGYIEEFLKTEYMKYVKCNYCKASTKLYFSEEEAIKAWNTRKPMEGIIDYLEEFMEKQYDSYNNAKRTGNIRQMDYSDGCAEGLIEAIEIIKIEGGIE